MPIDNNDDIPEEFGEPTGEDTVPELASEMPDITDATEHLVSLIENYLSLHPSPTEEQIEHLAQALGLDYSQISPLIDSFLEAILEEPVESSVDFGEDGDEELDDNDLTDELTNDGDPDSRPSPIDLDVQNDGVGDRRLDAPPIGFNDGAPSK